MLILKREERGLLVRYGLCIVSSTCTIQSSLACYDYKTLKKSFTLLLHESLKPAANCLSLEGSQGNLNKDPAGVLIGVHRAALLCFMDLIQAVLSTEM